MLHFWTSYLDAPRKSISCNQLSGIAVKQLLLNLVEDLTKRCFWHFKAIAGLLMRHAGASVALSALLQRSP